MKKLFLILITITTLSSCNNNLSRGKAEELIKSGYNFPIIETVEFAESGKAVSETETAKRKKMLDEQLISIFYDPHQDVWNRYYFTEDANKYMTKYQEWKGADIISNSLVFGEITGIAMGEDSKSARVEFSVKRKGITPFGEYFGYKEGDLVQFSCTFTKYDDGWRFYTRKKIINSSKYPFFTKEGEYIPNVK